MKKSLKLKYGSCLDIQFKKESMESEFKAVLKTTTDYGLRHGLRIDYTTITTYW